MFPGFCYIILFIFLFNQYILLNKYIFTLYSKKTKMLYNLPNGKTIYLTIEEYLNLTDQDIQELVALNFGNYIDPYQRSLANETDLNTLDPELIDIELFPLEDREEDNPNYEGFLDDDFIDFSDPYDM